MSARLASREDTLRPTAPILWALWFGLVGGAIEVTCLAVRKFVLHRYIFFDGNVVWMAPLAVAALLVIPGIGLAFLTRRWPGIVSPRVCVFLMVFPAIVGPLLIFGQVHRHAALFLAVGLAVQTARLIHVRAPAFHSLVCRSLPWMAAGVLVLALSLPGLAAVRERRAVAALTELPPGAPNVLLIVLDTVRASDLALGDSVSAVAPNLHRFARTGVRFERAIAPAPWTTPSHASMFTGRLPHETSVGWQTALDATHPTLAEVLAARGYMTAGFVANIDYCGRETGLDRGFAHYEGYALSPTEVALSSAFIRTVVNYHPLRVLFRYYEVPARKTAADVNAHFLRWLSGVDRRPFFAFLNYFDAHEPFLPPAPYDVRFGSAAPRKNELIFSFNTRQAKRHDKSAMSRAEIEAEHDAYRGLLSYLDHHLGVLFDALATRDVLHNTLIIITADHGEQFGEHGLFDHGNSLYSPLLRVPLLIVFPRNVPEGVVVRAAVGLRDLPATVLDLIGIGDDDRFSGGSLARYWRGTSTAGPDLTDAVVSGVDQLPDGPGSYPVSKGNMRSLVVGSYHYILGGDQREELYDLDADPLEHHDLSDSPTGQLMLGQLRSQLALNLATETKVKEAAKWTLR